MKETKNDSTVTLTKEGPSLTGRDRRDGLGPDSEKLGFPKKQGFLEIEKGSEIGQDSKKLGFPKEKQGFRRI